MKRLIANRLLPLFFICLLSISAYSQSSNYVPNQFIIQTVGLSQQQIFNLRADLGVNIGDIEDLGGLGFELWNINLPVQIEREDGSTQQLSSLIDVTSLVSTVVQGNDNTNLNYIVSNPLNSWLSNYSLTNYDPFPNCSENYSILPGPNHVDIAIIDGGIERDINLFSGRVTNAMHYNVVNENDPVFAANDHGTLITSIIDNMLGAAGMTDASISMYQIFDQNGNATLANVIKAFHMAIENQANLIQMSIGYVPHPQDQSDLLENLINYYESANTFVCISAGNSGHDLQIEPYYPAGFELRPGVIVAASDCDNGLASFSNYSPNTVFMAAPGTEVLGAFPNGQYYLAAGTSGAAAAVGGGIALLLSHELNTNKVRCAIINGVDQQPWLSGKVATSGLLWDLSSVAANLNNPQCEPGLYVGSDNPNMADNNLKEKQIAISNKLEINPNPFSDNIQLRFGAMENGIAEVQLYTLTGQLLKSKTLDVHKGLNRVNFQTPIDQMSSNIYLIQVTVDGHHHIEKIVFSSK